MPVKPVIAAAIGLFWYPDGLAGIKPGFEIVFLIPFQALHPFVMSYPCDRAFIYIVYIVRIDSFIIKIINIQACIRIGLQVPQQSR